MDTVMKVLLASGFVLSVVAFRLLFWSIRQQRTLVLSVDRWQAVRDALRAK